jgi:ABC-type branched-subunit amino acid transport system ATPase component
VTGASTVALARRGLLRMFQMTRVFPRICAFDNLLTAGLARGLAESESASRADALLEELTLGPVRHLDAGQLSGGQRKLLEFGMCFIAPPRIALLDEPVRRGASRHARDHGGLHPPPQPGRDIRSSW